ncbi:hypothetical protein CEV31_0415 [Brucella thiophenivorans]|uniref:Uncharacterized protein n=1 Tax=Brucella thiophenivorans TaxID=571255 RepID=A0A256G517_9HYPH|nr:hypothetical protein CEV31_0415 [Brucella thiophenivorans]
MPAPYSNDAAAALASKIALILHFGKIIDDSSTGGLAETSSYFL